MLEFALILVALLFCLHMHDRDNRRYEVKKQRAAKDFEADRLSRICHDLMAARNGQSIE